MSRTKKTEKANSFGLSVLDVLKHGPYHEDACYYSDQNAVDHGVLDFFRNLWLFIVAGVFKLIAISTFLFFTNSVVLFCFFFC